MVWEFLVRYLHYLGIISLFASLVLEHVLIERELNARAFRRVATTDIIYGVSAVVVLTAGLLLWFVVGKPAGFYTTNWVFHLKLTLFVLIAGLSIYPTIYFIKHRNSDQETITVPSRIILFIRLELTLLILLPMLGILISNGVGLG